MTRVSATRLGLAALVAVLWGHGFYLGAGAAGSGTVIGAISGAIILALQAALAAGVEGPHAAVLIAPLLTALSPTFARAAMRGGEEMLLLMLLFSGIYRSFTETHRSGSVPWSAVVFGGAAGFGRGGLVVLGAAFLQKIIFARRFRLGLPVYRFAFIWLALALVTFGLLRGVGGIWGPVFGSGQHLVEANGARIGIGGPLIRLWAEVDGLAVLPYMLVLVVGWKPKATFFLLTLIGLLLAGWLALAARSAAGRVGPMYPGLGVVTPAIPLVLLIVGLGVRRLAPILETSGLGGRARSLVIALIITSLALGQAWPTLELCMLRAR